MVSGCPSELIQKEMSKVSFSGWDEKSKVVSLFISYTLYLKHIVNLIRMNLYLLHIDQGAWKSFTPGSMITFHNIGSCFTRNMGICFTPYLVWVKLYQLEQTVGTCFMVIVVKFIKMLQKQQYSLAP